jgi:hypothetical protein
MMVIILIATVVRKSVEREKPGGVMSAASGFFRKVLSSYCWISSGVGRLMSTFLGM